MLLTTFILFIRKSLASFTEFCLSNEVTYFIMYVFISYINCKGHGSDVGVDRYGGRVCCNVIRLYVEFSIGG